ncbi:MAG TPA: hypothetical protein VMR45_02620 [Patescibacteria group bacterium]|nr:hypothetical protein [Patescibacteria group bacterium]
MKVNNKDQKQPQPYTPRKVFDVHRPGRAPASPTSRPLITGHKPVIRDPAVTVNGVAEHRSLMDSKQKVQIDVAGAAVKQAEDIVEKSTESQPVAVKPSVQPVNLASVSATTPISAPTPAPVKESQPEAPKPKSPSSPPDPSKELKDLGYVNMPTANEDALLDDLPSPDIQEVQQPAISHHMPRKHTALKVIIAIVVALLIATLVTDVLLDAGFLEWRNIPHTRFF